MNRRGFLGAILATAAAPAIAKADSLMRIVAPRLIVWGDGIHDDHAALQAFLDGRPVINRSGARLDRSPSGVLIAGGMFAVSGTLVLPEGAHRIVGNVFGGMRRASPLFEIPAGRHEWTIQPITRPTGGTTYYGRTHERT